MIQIDHRIYAQYMHMYISHAHAYMQCIFNILDILVRVS